MAERPFDAGSRTKNVSGDYDQCVCYKCKKSNAIHHGKRCYKHFICAKCFVSHNKQEDLCDHHSAFPLQPSVTSVECPDAPVHLPLAPNKCITHPENDQRSKFKVEVSLQSGPIVFTPITRGPHQLHVKVHDIDIPGSPFRIPVTEKEINLQEHPTSTPGECADGPVPLPPAPIITCYITYSDSDQYYKCSKVEMSSQSGQYKIGFTPITCGPHQLHVKVHDIDIAGSPFSIPVPEKEVNLQENPNSVKRDECILPPASDGGFG